MPIQIHCMQLYNEQLSREGPSFCVNNMIRLKESVLKTSHQTSQCAYGFSLKSLLVLTAPVHALIWCLLVDQNKPGLGLRGSGFKLRQNELNRNIGQIQSNPAQFCEHVHSILCFFRAPVHGLRFFRNFAFRHRTLPPSTCSCSRRDISEPDNILRESAIEDKIKGTYLWDSNRLVKFSSTCNPETPGWAPPQHDSERGHDSIETAMDESFVVSSIERKLENENWVFTKNVLWSKF